MKAAVVKSVRNGRPSESDKATPTPTFLQRRREALKDLKYDFIRVNDWVDVQVSGDNVPKCIQRGWHHLDIYQKALMTAIVMNAIRRACKASRATA